MGKQVQMKGPGIAEIGQREKELKHDADMEKNPNIPRVEKVETQEELMY